MKEIKFNIPDDYDMDTKVEYSYEQLATMVVQMQGLVNTLSAELQKVYAEKAMLQDKLFLIKKVFD